jgi:hypothetical protein
MLSIKVSQLFTIPKGSAITMAVCPKCGSSHIAIARDTDINWGRAIIGWAAFGVVGGAVAGVTGKDRNAVACLDCGASWQPAAVFSVAQLVKEVTGKDLDLSLESHRFYLERFFSELSPYIDSEISKAQDQSNKIILEAKNNVGPRAKAGSLIGLALFFFFFYVAFLFPGIGGFVILAIGIALSIACTRVAANLDKEAGWSLETKIKESEEKSAVVIENSKENIRDKIVAFPLNIRSDYVCFLFLSLYGLAILRWSTFSHRVLTADL